MTRIVPNEVRHNSFDKDTFRQIKALLENIPSQCFEGKQVAKIAELIALQSRWPKEEMMWVVSIEPAYFLQYKKESSAILVVDGVTVIAYRPKYLEYPQIVEIPKLRESESIEDIDAGPVELQLLSKGTGTSDVLAQTIKQFLSKYYATFYGQEGVKAAEFETNLLRNLKYYLSKYSRQMYWHAVLGPSSKTAVHQFDQIPVSLKLRIGSQQPKHLFMYSLKGVNDPIRNVIRNKWKQILAFIMLFLLLLVVVACPNVPPPSPETQYSFNTPQQSSLTLGFCANRTTIYYVIGGFFFLMTGMQIANRKKPRLPPQQKTE